LAARSPKPWWTTVHASRCSLDRAAIASDVNQMVEKRGRLDVVFANAGIDGGSLLGRAD